MLIGMFDSGIGGISVLKEIKKKLPNENIIYFGDTKRIPYGNKNQKEIIELSYKIVLFLIKKKVDVIIIACNTTSALALNYLKKTFNIPIIGILKSGAEAAVNITKGKIGVLATEATIQSKCYEKEIKIQKQQIEIISICCPELVPIIEKGNINSLYLKNILKKYLEYISFCKCDTLILGCTHYSFLINIIKKLLYNSIKIIDPAKYISKYLNQLNIQKQKIKTNEDNCYVSGDSNNFYYNLMKFFPKHSFKKIISYDPIDNI